MLRGEPGMGKSRLCYEGITRHLPPPWACLETRAVAYGQAIPYLPMIDLLKAYFRLDDRDRAPTIRHKAIPSLWKRVCRVSSRREVWWASRGPIAWARRPRPCRCRP